jgi:two-component system sensor histidine kinase/response regulator
MALLIGEYLYPTNISNPYTSDLNRYLDMGFSYMVSVILISWITIYIRNSYHREKVAVELKSKELDKNNRAKDKLFSILAHDLRSPLGSIQNFLEILTELDLEEDEKRSIKKSLLNETKNTMQMLSNMLAWSKAQMEGVSAQLAEVNLVETLHLTLQIQQTVAAEKRIRRHSTINPAICIQADPDMLQMVVRNLINNAIKFTSSGGEINISTVTEGHECTILIRDNGIGIPYDDQKEIFSLNAKSTFGTQKEKGMGLGLLLCKEFTELQEGKIWFKSTPGEGTTFYVNFQQCSFQFKPDGQLIKTGAPVE